VTFSEVLTAAVAEMSRAGYQSEAQVQGWLQRIRYAAQAEMISDAGVLEQMRMAMGAVYQRETARGFSETNPGVGRFTVQMLTPRMQAEMERRVRASADLIKLNKQEAVERTLSRFQGWCTSIPKGGSDVVDKRAIKAELAKPTREVRYQARRVSIDQGAKLTSALSEIVAQASGAIAGKWRHIAPRAGYQPRRAHVERNGLFYAVRGCWAIEQGLMKAVWGYTDEITAPAEEVFCSCKYVWISTLANLPDEMLTVRGREYLVAQRAA
jgi:hypothetical protein